MHACTHASSLRPQRALGTELLTGVLFAVSSTAMAGSVRILPLSESRDLLVSYLPAALVIKLQEVGLGLLRLGDRNGECCGRYVVTRAEALWELRALLATESEHSGVDGARSSTSLDPGVCRAALIIDAVEKAWRADDATLERSLVPILQLCCPDAGEIAAHSPVPEAANQESFPQSSGVSLACLMLSVPTLRMGVARCLLQEALERDLHSPFASTAETSKASLSVRCVSELRWLNSAASPIRLLPAFAQAEGPAYSVSEDKATTSIEEFVESLLGALGVASPTLQVALLEALPELLQDITSLERYELALARALPGLLEGAVRGEKGEYRLLNTVIDTANTLRTTQARASLRKSLLSEILSLVPSMRGAESLATALQFLVGVLESLKLPDINDGALLTASDATASESSTAEAIIQAIRENLLAETESPHDVALVVSAVAYALHHAHHAVMWMLAWYREGARSLISEASSTANEHADVVRGPQLADLFLILALFRASPDRFVPKPVRVVTSAGRQRHPSVADAASAYLLDQETGREALQRWGFILNDQDGNALLELIHRVCMPHTKGLVRTSRVPAMEASARLLAAFFRTVRSLRQTCLLSLLEHTHSESEYRRHLSLHAFACIAREAPRELAIFAPLIHGLVELCETLAPPEWRYLLDRSHALTSGIQPGLGTADALQLTLMYRSIALMHRVVSKSDADQDKGGAQSMDPFVPLVVRKLLTHIDVLNQRCGCVAAAIFISTWSEDNSDHLRAVELLELSLQCTERRALVAAQLYAELGVAMTTHNLVEADDTERHVARSVPARWLLSHALQRLTAQFICLFVSETESQERASSSKPRYAIRSEGAPSIMIPLASIIQSRGEDAQSLATLVPLFRLVWTLGLAQHGYESEWFRNELWPLLGAAVELPRALCSTNAESRANDRLRDQRLCLAAALNWLRAQVHCLSVLVQQGSEVARTYLKQRLEHLAELDAVWRRDFCSPATSSLGSNGSHTLSYRFPASIATWLLAETAAGPDSDALLWALRELGSYDNAVIDANAAQLVRISAANLSLGSSLVAMEALHALGRASCLDAELFCQEIVPRLPRSRADIETDEMLSSIVLVVSRLGHLSIHHGESLHQWLAWVLSERFPNDTQRMHAVLRAAMSLIRKVLDTAPSEPALEWATKTLETYLPVGHTCENCAQLCIACQLDSHPGWLATIADAIGQSFRIWCLQQVPSHASARPQTVARVAAPIRTDHFVAFGRFARLLKTLLDKAVQTRDRRALGASMRLGRIFADHLNHRLVPFWMADFGSNSGLIASSCALFQKSTRILQRLCAYAKEQRDRSLAAQTPPLKKALELFLYRVKGMLSANASLSSFWMGTLRHKNLQGEVVGSQLQEGSDSSESEDSTTTPLSPVAVRGRTASSTTVTSRSGTQQE